jgi:hypothetical protein
VPGRFEGRVYFDGDWINGSLVFPAVVGAVLFFRMMFFVILALFPTFSALAGGFVDHVWSRFGWFHFEIG